MRRAVENADRAGTFNALILSPHSLVGRLTIRQPHEGGEGAVEVKPARLLAPKGRVNTCT